MTQSALALRGMVKHFGAKVAVGGVDLDVPAGSFFGLVGPNGAGKTTLLSMATGLLRPDRGQVHVRGTDLWADPVAGKRQLGILPDGMKLFDRLSGAELIHYAGVLRGMDQDVVHQRRAALLAALDLEDAANVLVVDYSAGMTKKIALATALVHAPPILVLDEPFEAVDPVSAGVIRQILRTFVGNGGTVVLSSHVMEVVESLCDHVAVMAEAQVRAAGPLDEVRAGRNLQDRFIELVGGGRDEVEGLEWLRT